jgi:hypothetical protein
VILGRMLLILKWGLAILLAAYLFQFMMQLYLEERELKARFGKAYVRYCRLVPRFIPRLTPVDPARSTATYLETRDTRLREPGDLVLHLCKTIDQTRLITLQTAIA